MWFAQWRERKRLAREAQIEHDRKWNEQYLADSARKRAEKAAWWNSLTPAQQEAEQRRQQLNRIENKLRRIEWRQNYDPDDYDIV